MLVSAQEFPAAALWQGLMMCAMPLWAFVAFRKESKDIVPATVCYALFGGVLLVRMTTDDIGLLSIGAVAFCVVAVGLVVMMCLPSRKT